MALPADAGHNRSNVLGLVLAWGATILAKRSPNRPLHQGLKGCSILASLFDAVFLLVAVGAIGWEAIQRFGDPVPDAGQTMMDATAVGGLVNGITASLFAYGAKDDIKITVST